jgi:dihydroorotate dehydrogenase
MDADALSYASRMLYSFIEKLPEYPTIELMRFLFRILPIENLTDYEVHDESLKTVLRGTNGSGMELENPVILAAAYSESYMLEKALKLGFAAVTAKCSKEPMEGNKGRTIIRTPEGPLNSVGYKNMGKVKSYAYLEKIRKKAAPSKRMFLNISDSCIENYISVIRYMDEMELKNGIAAVDAFELSRCPNKRASERLDFFSNHEYAKDLFREARKATKKPIILKLPRRKDFPGIYRHTIPIAIDNGVTILNYANTEIVEDSRFETGFCGRSGPALLEDTIENVDLLYREFGDYADIIATGGIYSPAGAYLVGKKGAKGISYATAFPADIFLAKRINQVFSEWFK